MLSGLDKYIKFDGKLRKIARKCMGLLLGMTEQESRT
jgi:hypothetical protein